jgi:ribonuclease Z
MEFVILGSSGWMPGIGRQTASFALAHDQGLLLFDAGTGLCRLVQPGYRRLLAGEGTVHLLLSHLHLDHTVGLTYLPGILEGRRTVVHVPAGPLGEDTSVLDRLLGTPFFPVALRDFPLPLEVRPLPVGTLELDGLRVQVRAQRHPGGSVGFRVADHFALLTDTVFDPDAVGFVNGVRLLAHEAWIRGEDDPPELRRTLEAHTAAADAARVAAAAGVGELLLVHLNPLRDADYHGEMLERSRRAFPATQLGYDGLSRLL